MEQASVAVICVTYNHEKYIEEALEGFVSQITSFPFQVLVGDDCSTDRTPAIIQKYAEAYPDIIVPVIRTKNITAGRNWQDLVSRTASTYLAFCDGDDYWTDPFKLQKQYDYMNSHPDLRACFHDAKINIETSSGTWFQSKDYSNTADGSLLWPSGNKRFFKQETYRIENFIPFGFVHTSSMFIKWDYEIGFPEWFFGHGVGDYPMWILQVNTGRFGYIDEVMSVHRRTDTGSYSFTDRTEFWRKSKPGWVTLDECLIEHFRKTYRAPSIINALVSRQKDDLAKLIRGSLECDQPRESWQLMIRFSNIIKKRFGVTVSGDYTEPKFNKAIQRLQTCAPLPPYNYNLISRMLRKVNKARERRMIHMK